MEALHLRPQATCWLHFLSRLADYLQDFGILVDFPEICPANLEETWSNQVEEPHAMVVGNNRWPSQIKMYKKVNFSSFYTTRNWHFHKSTTEAINLQKYFNSLVKVLPCFKPKNQQKALKSQMDREKQTKMNNFC